MQHGELRTDRCPWFVDRLFKLYTYISNISIAGSSISYAASLHQPRSERTSSIERVRGDPSREPEENQNQKKNKDNDRVRGDPLRDLPEWLEDFAENLVDESVPKHRDAPARSSRESGSETRGKVVSGKHSKDRNCDMCLGTKITKAPCRRRVGGAVPREEIFGDLITADHKKGCGSRNNLVQDLANHTDPVVSVQNKNFSENTKELAKVLGARWETKSHVH